MKVLPFKIPKTAEHSIHVQVDRQPCFYDTLHQHPEIQITWIVESTGTLILGDHVGDFKPGDVFLIGANVPHVFRNDDRYYQGDPELEAHGISVFFEKGVFGADFFKLPEMREVGKLINLSERGVKVAGETGRAFSVLIGEMSQLEGLAQLVRLFEVFKLLTVHPEDLHVLTSGVIRHELKDSEGARLNTIFQFTMKEYHRPIMLEEVAGIAHMSVSAFCRYFKKSTRKTYVHFLNEVRIGKACKMLVHEGSNVTEACYSSGFNNLSNFNRKFKAFTGYTPREYVKLYRKQ